MKSTLCSYSHFIFFSIYCYSDHRDLHSFPTRRSSDLVSRDDVAAVLKLWFPQVVDFHAVEWQSTTDRKSTRLNSSHVRISYAVFCLKKKNLLIYAFVQKKYLMF